MSAKIVGKIKKLLAISEDDSASDAEIQTCIAMARKLMDSYHLSEDDLGHEPADDFAAVDAADFGIFRSWLSAKCYHWEGQLAVFVKEQTGASCYVHHKEVMRSQSGIVQMDNKGKPIKASSIAWYGVAEDCMIAMSFYNDLRSIIATMAVARYGSVYKGDGGKYSEGFVAGLFAAARESQKKQIALETTSTAMVLRSRRDALVRYKEDKARSWLKKEHNINLGKRSGSGGARGSAEAYSTGRGDGRSHDATASRTLKLN